MGYGFLLISITGFLTIIMQSNCIAMDCKNCTRKL